MVLVEEADRDVLRFLWVKDFKREMPEFKIYRFTRVVFGVSSSLFLLNAIIWFHLEGYLKTNELHVWRLLCSTYVDDIITGGATEDGSDRTVCSVQADLNSEKVDSIFSF